MNDRRLDITTDHCPMTYVKTKLALEKLGTGERLELLLKAGEPLENVPRSAMRDGYRVIVREKVTDDVYRLIIEK
ncbi:MAG: sulfurtransferase TusA family protein [Spirochaetota bacterium]|jgi:tRNA 2-thiouridine synthesizing protein A